MSAMTKGPREGGRGTYMDSLPSPAKLSPATRPEASEPCGDQAPAPPFRVPYPVRLKGAQITLQDVANRAGVSRTTVSMALRNHPGLPSSTRRRIQAIAEELGYRPNPLVSCLMSYQRAARADQPKHLVLALVLKFSRRDPWWEYLSPELISGARSRAEQLGYRLEEFWLDDLGMDGARLTQVLRQRSVPGVLMAPLPAGARQLAMDWEGFSAVGIGYSEAGPQLHRVRSDHYQAMFLGLAEMRQRGYQRFGLALEAGQDDRVHHQWSAAFAWDQLHRPAPHQVPLLLLDRSEWNERRFGAWFRRHRPQVVLGCDPRIVAWLHRLGWEVPGDAGFLHLGVPDLSGEFAGLYGNAPALGATSVDLLVALIQSNERGLPASPTTTQLEASWVDGKTLQVGLTRSPHGLSPLGETLPWRTGCPTPETDERACVAKP
jgi:LacI family transcriptional regulator